MCFLTNKSGNLEEGAGYFNTVDYGKELQNPLFFSCCFFIN